VQAGLSESGSGGATAAVIEGAVTSGIPPVAGVATPSGRRCGVAAGTRKRRIPDR